MYVVYINLLYFLSIFLFTYNKNLLSQKILHQQNDYSYGNQHSDLLAGIIDRLCKQKTIKVTIPHPV